MNEDLQKSVITLEKALKREKSARKMAEQLLEQRSREIYETNQNLENQIREAKLQQLQLSFLTGLSADIWNADSVNKTVQIYLRRSSEFLNNAQCIFFQLKSISTNKTFKLTSVMDLESDFQQLPANSDVSLKDIVISFKLDVLMEALDDAGGESLLQPIHLVTDLSTNYVYVYLVPSFNINDNQGYACFFYSDHKMIDVLKLQSVESSRSMLAIAIQKQMATVNLKMRFKELKNTHEKLDDTQKQLMQSERMASIGQLAAGVAHEINNPIGFILSNYETLAEYVEVLNNILNLYPTIEDDSTKSKLSEIWASEDVDFIREDLSELLVASKNGLNRVQEIVAGLKSFSHNNTASYIPMSLNDCVEDSIQLVWNELKYNCEIIRNLNDIPEVVGNYGQIEQVIVNMLINAKHAMEDTGVITLETKAEKECVVLIITDNGMGISEENIQKLFTPFFTTKAVGVGTGLGLSISYGILTDHGASIDVKSEVGKGTTFTITFPPFEPAL